MMIWISKLLSKLLSKLILHRYMDMFQNSNTTVSTAGHFSIEFSLGGMS